MTKNSQFCCLTSAGIYLFSGTVKTTYCSEMVVLQTKVRNTEIMWRQTRIMQDVLIQPRRIERKFKGESKLFIGRTKIRNCLLKSHLEATTAGGTKTASIFSCGFSLFPLFLPSVLSSSVKYLLPHVYFIIFYVPE